MSDSAASDYDSMTRPDGVDREQPPTGQQGATSAAGRRDTTPPGAALTPSAAIDWDGNLLPPRDRYAKSYLTEPDPDFLIARCDELEAALQKIAAPKRPDGTYNLSREACEQIAKEALDGQS